MTDHDKARDTVEQLRLQRNTDEMERHEIINADFEGAYNWLIADCRAAADQLSACVERCERLEAEKAAIGHAVYILGETGKAEILRLSAIIEAIAHRHEDVSKAGGSVAYARAALSSTGEKG
ncbi:hypothetical protein SAMN04244548_01229 [Paracoccus pantotrophus]|nr:hypothetical protein SAMN04244548_01229 [Paracoccus pantotrophus]